MCVTTATQYTDQRLEVKGMMHLPDWHYIRGHEQNRSANTANKAIQNKSVFG